MFTRNAKNRSNFTSSEIQLTQGQIALADPGGAPGTRAPPGGPNSFIFMQFSAKM